LSGWYSGSCSEEPLMSLVLAPARRAASSTYFMALSVEELARNVPPTATMYGELKGLPM
jgi:hypothetical protein